MRIINNVSFVLIVAIGYTFLIFGCKRDSNEIRIEKQDLEQGYLYHLKKGDSLILDIGVLQSGELKYVLNFTPTHDQMIFFHEKTGVIESKLKKNQDMKTTGRAYYFHNMSGNLSSDYNYVDGIRTGSAVSYHDSTDRVKSVMLYNDLGEMYYRKTFDKNGNMLKVEGSKD